MLRIRLTLYIGYSTLTFIVITRKHDILEKNILDKSSEERQIIVKSIFEKINFLRLHESHRYFLNGII